MWTWFTLFSDFDLLCKLFIGWFLWLRYPCVCGCTVFCLSVLDSVQNVCQRDDRPSGLSEWSSMWNCFRQCQLVQHLGCHFYHDTWIQGSYCNSLVIQQPYLCHCYVNPMNMQLGYEKCLNQKCNCKPRMYHFIVTGCYPSIWIRMDQR